MIATTIARATVDTPIGVLRLYVGEGVLSAVLFPEEDESKALARLGLTGRPIGVAPEAAGIAERLRAYFAGELQAPEVVPADPDGTPFAREVRLALRRIPPGATWSYAQLAAAIGRPRAVRAVGRAIATNPVPIVLPCHRVIGGDGRLTGYGGGLPRKAWLLRHEGARFRD